MLLYDCDFLWRTIVLYYLKVVLNRSNASTDILYFVFFFKLLLLGVVVIQRAYRRHKARDALDKLIAIKKLLHGNEKLICFKFQHEKKRKESLLPPHYGLVVKPIEPN